MINIPSQVTLTAHPRFVLRKSLAQYLTLTNITPCRRSTLPFDDLISVMMAPTLSHPLKWLCMSRRYIHICNLYPLHLNAKANFFEVRWVVVVGLPGSSEFRRRRGVGGCNGLCNRPIYVGTYKFLNDCGG